MIDTPRSSRPRGRETAGPATAGRADWPAAEATGAALRNTSPRDGRGRPVGPGDDPTGVVGRPGPARILVIGDVILDRYVWDGGGRGGGAPILVLRAAGRPGRGAGLGPLRRGPGARATLVGIAGDDPEGEAVRRLLGAAGVPRAAPAAIRRHRAYRLDLARWLPPLVAAHDFTLVSAYARDAGGPGLLADVLGWADAAGRPVLVDPAPVGTRGSGGGATGLPPARSVTAGGRAPGRQAGLEAVVLAMDPADPTPAWRVGEGPAPGRQPGDLMLIVPGASSPAGEPKADGRFQAAARRPEPAATDGRARVESEGRRCRAT